MTEAKAALEHTLRFLEKYSTFHPENSTTNQGVDTHFSLPKTAREPLSLENSPTMA